MLVISFHVIQKIKPTDTLTYTFKTVFAGTWGWVGVDLFFVISGYLITRILLHIRGEPHCLRSFYLRRICRIVPLYYASLVLFGWLVPQLPFDWAETLSIMPQDWLRFLFFTANSGTHIFTLPYYLHFWTLCLEMHFYLLWPLVVLWIRPSLLLRVSICLIMAIALLRLALIMEGVNGRAVYINSVTHMDIPLYGALIAILEYEHKSLASFCHAVRILTVISFFGLIILAYFSQGLRFYNGMTEMFGFMLDGILFASILLLTLQPDHNRRLTRILENPFFSICGKYSYGMYIFHYPLIRIISMITGDDTITVMLLLPCAIGIALICGFLSWHLIEKQFLKIPYYKT